MNSGLQRNILQYIPFPVKPYIKGFYRTIINNNLVIGWAITKLLYSKVLNNHKANTKNKINGVSAAFIDTFIEALRWEKSHSCNNKDILLL